MEKAATPSEIEVKNWRIDLRLKTVSSLHTSSTIHGLIAFKMVPQT
jgi:hypothetical protein